MGDPAARVSCHWERRRPRRHLAKAMRSTGESAEDVLEAPGSAGGPPASNTKQT